MRNLFWGMLFILIGVLLLLDNLGIADFSEIMHDYWPLILVLWGAAILYRKKNRSAGTAAPAQEAPPPPSASPSGDTGSQAPPQGSAQAIPPAQPAWPPPSQPWPGTLPTELIQESQVFGNVNYRILSDRFKGGSISTVFGDIRLDLTGTTIAEGDHELKIHSVFGNTVVIIPANAPVSVAASALAGTITLLGVRKSGFGPDLSTMSQTYGSSPGRLRIAVSKVFGDIRVE